MNMIPIIIPAYEPDERMITLAQNIKNAGLKNIIIVNDGSGKEYDHFYSEAKEILNDSNCVLLSHEVNKGKGRALKTAFDYVINNMPESIGVVTIDSDGQHTVECMHKIMVALDEHPQDFILGVRQFDGENIPWKSRFGNNLTLKVLKLVSGLDVQDTQTGLRGIPIAFMKELINVSGERFEFEMKMLLESVHRYPIIQIPIQTIYDSKENHQTHFNPVKDSLKIYKILFGKFIKFIITSVTSFIIDILLFTVFCSYFRNLDSILYITYATIVARIISSVYNYLMNYSFVFKSNEKRTKSALKYFTLVIVQMACSSLFVSILSPLFNGLHDTLCKIVVDTVLFFVSYKIQKSLIFKSKA